MITIAATPHPLSWIDNHPSFTVECSGIQSGGRRASIMLRFAHTNLLYSFSLLVDGHTLTFKRALNPSSNPYTFYDINELVSKIEGNYYIAYSYTVASSSLSTYDTITLTSKTIARHDIAIVGRSAYVSVASEDAGEDMTVLSNYGVVARFELSDGTLTPWCRYTPVDGSVHISTDQLRGFFEEPTLPVRSALSAQPLNATLRYRLQVAESYGEPPVMQLISRSGWMLLADGEVNATFAGSDLPDWVDYLPGKTLSFAGVRPRILGTDTNRTYDVRRGKSYYLYALINDTSNTPADTTDLSVAVTYTTDGESTTDTHSCTLNNGTISRMDVGPATLSLPGDVTSYLVTITDDDDNQIFAARFVLRVVPYRSQDFLLQDKYGLLRAVVAGSFVTSAVSEGDEATYADGRKVHVLTSREQRFSVTTSYLRRDEAAMIADALLGRNAYVKANGQWCRISIVPGSFTSWDDEADMVRISWTYSIEANQRSNVATACYSPNRMYYTDDLNYEEPMTYNE